MSDAATCDFIHAYFVASDIQDLDAAFEDGKERAIKTLLKRIEKIRSTTRADYNKAFGIEDQALAAERGGGK